VRIDACVIKSPGTTVVSDKMVATAVEVIVEAVYLDGWEGALERIMRRLGFGDHVHL
jgi:ribonuclease-3